MNEILKEIHVVLTEAEIESPDDIKILIHVHESTDPNNEEGVTYTIEYPKNK